MMRQPIRLEVKIEATDVVRASRELLIRRAGALFVAWCAIAGVGLYLFLAGTGSSGFGWPIVLAILAAAFGPPAILFELVIWNARRRFKQAAHETAPDSLLLARRRHGRLVGQALGLDSMGSIPGLG